MEAVLYSALIVLDGCVYNFAILKVGFELFEDSYVAID
jgi:hypothetical protein